MKTISLLSLLVAAVSGHASASDVLNIPAVAGTISSAWGYGYSECALSPRGGIMHAIPASVSDGCVVEFPIPLSGNHTIKQIIAYYGTTSEPGWGGLVEFYVTIGYRELKISQNSTSADNDTGIEWLESFADDDSNSEIFAKNLMHQSGFPIINYTDAFTVGNTNAYYVRAYLRMLDFHTAPEIFGIKVIYD